MKPYRWSAAKNDRLKAERGLSFERVVVAIEADGLLDVMAHPSPKKYPRQQMLVVTFDGYAHLVSFVEEDEYYFLKTIIPSRKASRDYLLKDESDE